jgi:ABC-type multidrug transport system fused ATPase/permease subunit
MTTLAALRSLLAVAWTARANRFLAISAVLWLAQSLVDWAVALLLVCFLDTLGVVNPATLPAWLPAPFRGAGPLSAWLALFALGGTQAALQVAALQARVSSREQVRFSLQRLALHRAMAERNGPPMPLSRLNYLTSEIFNRAADATENLTQIVCYGAQGVAIAIAMLWVAPVHAVVGLITLGCFGWVVLLFNRWNQRAGSRQPDLAASFERAKVRVTRNWLLIRALRLEEREYASAREGLRALLQSRVTAYFFANLGGAIGPAMAILLLGAVSFTHVVLLRAPAAQLVALLYLLFRFQQILANEAHIVGGLFTYGHHIQEAARFVGEFDERSRAEALSDMPAARGGVRASPPRAADRTRALRPPRIDVQGLAFSWPGGAPVFRDLTVTAEAGTQLGLVGPNGSGKSTFLAVLLGTLQPSAGTICLDGMDADEWLSRAHSTVGFVGSEAYLVQGSIRENLCYGLDRDPPEADLARALEIVGLARRVLSLPNGLEHRIEESGEGLSSGEKQKLCLARALVRSPVLLVLDEPTANIDEKSERDIVEALRGLRGRCTIVITSHKPGSLIHVDQRLAFEDVPSRRAATLARI